MPRRRMTPPEPRETECHYCDRIASDEALADGYPLCPDHDDEHHREGFDEWGREQAVAAAVETAVTDLPPEAAEEEAEAVARRAEEAWEAEQ